MTVATETAERYAAGGDRTVILELADGTRLVPEEGAEPARLEADRDHAFTLADVLREGGEPFAGYRREAA